MKGFKKAVSVMVFAGAGLVTQAHAADFLVMEAQLEYLEACRLEGGTAYIQGQGGFEIIDEYSTRHLATYMRQMAEMNAGMSRQPVPTSTKAELHQLAMKLQSINMLRCSAGEVGFNTKADSRAATAESNDYYYEEEGDDEGEMLPFVGKQVVNFYGGSGTAQLINILESGKVIITSGDDIDFLGDFTNPLQVGSNSAYLFDDNGVYLLNNGKVETDCMGDLEECFYKFNSQASNTSFLKPVNPDVLDFDFYCSVLSTDDEFLMVGVGDGYDNVVVNYKNKIERLELQSELEVDANHQLVGDSLIWKTGDYTAKFVFTDKEEGDGVLMFSSFQDSEIQEASLFCRD